MGVLSWIAKGFFQFIVSKNQAYYKLVVEFRDKLPRPQNEGKILSAEEISKHKYLPETAKYVNTLDLNSIKSSLSEQDLDVFFNRLRNYDFSWMLCKKEYQAFSKNILRLQPEISPPNTDFGTLIKILYDDRFNQLKPECLFPKRIRLCFKQPIGSN